MVLLFWLLVLLLSAMLTLVVATDIHKQLFTAAVSVCSFVGGFVAIAASAFVGGVVASAAADLVECC